MSDDLINRQAAIDLIHKTVYGFFDIVDNESEEPISEKGKLLLEVNKAVSNGIKDLPSAQRWIPVSERLPEVNTRCLCTYENKEGTCIDFGLYMKRGWFVSGVTAWIPLPEPYKEEEA